MTFELSASKLGYIEIFMKIWGNKFDLFFKPFLTNRGKNKDEDEKIWKNEFDFWILHVKIGLYGNFHENPRKKYLPFLRHFWLIEAKYSECEKIWENEFDFWILHIKIRLYGTFHKNLRKNIFFEIFTWKGHTRTEVSRFNLILRQIFCISSISFEDFRKQ